MRIAILESLGIPAAELAALKAPFEAEGHTFVEYEKTGDVPALIAEAADAEALILANMPMPAEVLEACGKLRFVDIAFTGVDHVAMDVLRRRGITASNASGYSNEAVAELAVGMAIDLMRNVTAVEKRCRAGGAKDGLVGGELRGRTVGIVGVGRIGRRSAELFHAFGCAILGCASRRHDDLPEYIEQVGLEELLRRSDLVVLHCPLTDATRGMIDRARLAMMKPSAYLINLARGPVVVTRDLAEALNAGVIAGAAVDVFDHEPPLPADEPLLAAKNTLLTPHIAFASRESMSLRARIVFDNLRAFLDGAPVNVVR